MNSLASYPIAIALACISLGVSASQLQVTFLDPAGDQTISPDLPREIDLLSMTLVFDNETGSFLVSFVTAPAHPLSGSFELNANLVNGELPFPSERLPYQDMNNLFIDNFNEIVLDIPATEYSLSGVDLHLTHWQSGDRIAIDTCTFSPNCVDAGYTLMTTIQNNVVTTTPFDTFSQDQSFFGHLTPVAVPLPSALPLSVSILTLLLAARRQKSWAD